MTTNKRKALLVGCGSMAKNWINALQANAGVEIAGLVDLRREAAEETARRHGLTVPVFTVLDEALRSAGPDFVVDVTIPAAHEATTTAALAAGVPVLGEKPMAENLESARRMVAAAERSGKLYMVSQNYRNDPARTLARELVLGGEIGPLAAVNCDFYTAHRNPGFRAELPSPLLLDMAIHHFDCCRYLSGLDPEEVYAVEYNPANSWFKGNAGATVVFEMKGGALFTYRGLWCTEGKPTSWGGHWRLQGTRGALVLENDQPPSGQRISADAQPGKAPPTGEIVVPPLPAMATGLNRSLEDFLSALDSGQAPLSECHDNIKSLAMVLAAVESARRRQRVPVIW